MWYQAGADAVLLIHFGFILFVLLGGFLAWKWAWVPWLHLPAVGWGAIVALCGWYCPLTPLENALRRAGGSETFAGGFIEHYLLQILYPVGLTRSGQMVMGATVLVVNLIVYALVYHLLRR